jgi:hypothetical protein
MLVPIINSTKACVIKRLSIIIVFPEYFELHLILTHSPLTFLMQVLL